MGRTRRYSNNALNGWVKQHSPACAAGNTLPSSPYLYLTYPLLISDPCSLSSKPYPLLPNPYSCHRLTTSYCNLLTPHPLLPLTAPFPVVCTHSSTPAPPHRSVSCRGGPPRVIDHCISNVHADRLSLPNNITLTAEICQHSPNASVLPDRHFLFSYTTYNLYFCTAS